MVRFCGIMWHRPFSLWKKEYVCHRKFPDMLNLDLTPDFNGLGKDSFIM